MFQACRLCVALLLTLCAATLDAQVLRGSVRTLDGTLPIPSVQLTLRDTTGTVVGAARTDDAGLFSIALKGPARPFVVQARRLGFQLADTEVLRLTSADTVNLEFRLAEVVLEQASVEVTAMMQLNERRLEEAYRRGWRVYEPELVSLHSTRVRDLEGLLRAISTQSLSFPRSSRDCVRSSRTNQCVTYVVDGQVLGEDNLLLSPSEIYFLAVLSPAESRAQYGSRAMNGAIAIYTRARGDRINADRNAPSPRPPRREPQ